MNTDPSTPANDANLSALGRELLDTGGSKPTGRWIPPTAEELHELLPDYDIVKMLGRGGMGAVYMGRQTSLDRPVAIKILSTALEDADPSFAERFKNEARSMGRLSHPCIVGAHDFGETAGGLLYIVMEYVEGTDVAKMIAKQGRLHTDHAMAITAHVCDALAYAHERGIIHRDIKPANIMVGYDGVVKVADFGLAKMTQSANTGLTQSGMAMGTLHYMAPEALMLGSAVDHRADIYAVGVMLYQMLTGKIPQGMFKLPSLQIPGLDPRYDAIIAKAIMEDREARYQSVGEMRRDLDGILTQPVVKVEAEVSQAPAALPTQARPQRPGGKGYRPPQSGAYPAQPAAKSSSGGLVWAMVAVVVLGISGWVFFGKPRFVEQTTETGSPTELTRSEETQAAPSTTTVSSPSVATPAPPTSQERNSVAATTGGPFVNSLGMKFVPVPGTEVLFCIHETRYKDYAAYAAATPSVRGAWRNQSVNSFAPTENPEDHPVSRVSWEEVQAFCAWLSTAEGRIYRLPTDREWSIAVGIGRDEGWIHGTTPETVNQVTDEFPWGDEWPPKRGSGNYCDETRNATLPSGSEQYIVGYNDGYPTTAPVMKFEPNPFGLFDMGGNVWEWCGDWFGPDERRRVLRGGSYSCGDRGELLSSCRLHFPPGHSGINYGFRVVLEGVAVATETVPGPAPSPAKPRIDGLVANGEWQDVMELLRACPLNSNRGC